MKDRVCKLCYEILPAEAFYAKGSYCRQCTKDYAREHYRTTRKRKSDATYRALREIILKAKDRPCLDCGQKYPPYVLDFDHRDARLKKAGVSQLVSWKVEPNVLRDEIAKCDVVCKNCHAKRTHFRLAPRSRPIQTIGALRRSGSRKMAAADLAEAMRRVVRREKKREAPRPG